jgi:hypothetical protein
MPFTPIISPVELSPDDPLGATKSRRRWPHKLSMSPSRLEAAYAPPSGLGVPPEPLKLPSPAPWPEERWSRRSPLTMLGGGKLPLQAIKKLFPSASCLGWESPPSPVRFRLLNDEVPSPERCPDPSHGSSNGAATVCVRPCRHRSEPNTPPSDLARMTEIRLVNTLSLHKIWIIDLGLDDPKWIPIPWTREPGPWTRSMWL